MLKRMNQHRSNRSVALTVVFLCVGCISLSAEISQAGTVFNPPGGGAPSGRGGASRGTPCSSNPIEFSRHFLPLAPIDSKYGLTVSEHPTFFVNIPPSLAQKVFFSLKDEKGHVHYEAILPINKQGGIMRIDLPQSVSPLIAERPYEWGVAALCSEKLKPGSPFVSSWVKRITPSTSLAKQLTKAAPIDRAALYATNGIWYDTLTTLADVKQQQPNNANLLSDWKTLLNSVGLSEVSVQPLN